MSALLEIFLKNRQVTELKSAVNNHIFNLGCLEFPFLGNSSQQVISTFLKTAWCEDMTYLLMLLRKFP